MSEGQTGHAGREEGRPVSGPASRALPSNPNGPAAGGFDDAAALVLGALSGDEREAAMDRMESDAAFRRDVVELDAIARLLPLLTTLPDADRLPSAAGPVGPALPPSADLRARILDRVAADRPAADRPADRRATATQATVGEADGESTRSLPPSRRGGGAPIGVGRLDRRSGANFWLTVVMAAIIVVFALAAVALQVRNTTLSNDLDDLRGQVAALQDQSQALQNEVALANAQSNASAWVLNPNTAIDNPVPSEARGTAFYSFREQSVVAEIRGLPALGDGQIYQFWYLGGTATEEPPRSAGLMQSTSDGTVVFTADGVAQPFDAVAVSIEPAGGSTTPTTVVMLGTLSAAG